jgi:hypothetical protein
VRKVLLCFVLAFAGCASSSVLETGLWTGSLSPMNHLDSPTPIQFEVRSDSGPLSIDLVGPDGSVIPLINPIFDHETIVYSFREPEQSVLLSCKLEMMGEGVYEGKCQDSEGKWALFRMIAPSQSHPLHRNRDVTSAFCGLARLAELV